MSSNGSSQWLLLVDDHEDGRDLLSEFLQMNGFTVEGCASGEDALERIESKGPPSLVITDLSLGSCSMNGTDLAARLKQGPATKSVPILAVTGHAEYNNPDGLFEAVLVKPVALNELASKVRETLGK